MDQRQVEHGSAGMGGAGRMDARHERVSREDGAPRDRRQAERVIRSGIAEIEEAIDRLERTCRQGRITRGELAENRGMLEAQRRRLTRSD